MTTGEFAALCKTTKETVFHYDRQNLLKPRYVSENGYRRYAADQFFDFDLITTLKDAGSSLKEIKEHLVNKDGTKFLSLLEEKHLVIKKERERLAQRETMLQNMIICTREALDFEYDKFMIQDHSEEHLEAFPMDASPLDDKSEFVPRFAEYFEFYRAQERVPLLPFGFILGEEDVLQEQLQGRYFFSKATRSTPRSLLHLKPKGKYAVIAHQGTGQTHNEVFERLLRKAKAANLTVAGDAYVYDMMSDVFHGLDESYAAKYCIQIK